MSGFDLFDNIDNATLLDRIVDRKAARRRGKPLPEVFPPEEELQRPPRGPYAEEPQGVLGRILSRIKAAAGEELSGAVASGVEAIKGAGTEIARDPLRLLRPAMTEEELAQGSPGGRALLGGMGILFSPVSAAARAATEAPLVATEEITGATRPPAAEAARKVAQLATEMVAPSIPVARLLGRLRGLKTPPASAGVLGDLTEATPFVRDTFNMSPAEAQVAGLIEQAEGGKLKLTEKGMGWAIGRKAPVAALTERAGGPPPEGVFEGPPTPRPLRDLLEKAKETETGVPSERLGVVKQQMEEALRGVGKPGEYRVAPELTGEPGGRIIRGPQPRAPGGEKVPEIDVTAPDAPVQLVPTGSLKQERILPLDAVPREVVTDLGIGGRTRAIHIDNEIDASKVIEAAKNPADAPILPLETVAVATAGNPAPSALVPSFLKSARESIAGTKAAIGINSMWDIYRGIPAGLKLVARTLDAEIQMARLSKNWIAERAAIWRKYGADVSEEAARAADLGKIDEVTDPRVLEAGKEIRALLDDAAVQQGIPPGSSAYVQNFWSRARQNIVAEKTRLIEVGDYVASDIRRLIPRELRIRRRVLDTPSDRYDADFFDSYLRGASRNAVLGTQFKPGYLEGIRPILEGMSDLPESLQRFTAEYVNYFIGARSASETAERISRITRDVEFLRAIGGNLTSPIYNTMQRTLTFAEVRNSSFLRAFVDEANYWRGDPTTLAILDRSGIDLTAPLAEKLGMDASASATEAAGIVANGGRLMRDVLGSFFSTTETGNRVHAFFAGYRDALAGATAEDAAIKAGGDLVDKTQFSYGRATIPPRFRGPLGSVVGQFKTFQIRYFEYIKGQVDDLLRPEATLAGRAVAAKKMVKFWGSQVALGGPSVIPVIGDYMEAGLEKLGVGPRWRSGILPALGLGIADQIGFGTLTMRDLRSLLYFIPAAAFTHAQDMISGITGYDFGNGMNGAGAAFSAIAEGTPMRVLDEEQRISRLTRAIPLSGIQLNRLRRAFNIATSEEPGVERGGKGAPTDRLIRRNANAFLTGMGFQSEEEEALSKEYAVGARATAIRNQAIRLAAEAAARGESGEPFLIAAEDKLGLPRGSLGISSQARRAQQERAAMTPLERLRRHGGRELFPVYTAEEEKSGIAGTAP